MTSKEKQDFTHVLILCYSRASPVKEFPLMMSILFGQHKRLMELDKKIKSTDHHDPVAAATRD